jgi:hypothetical protein
MVVDAQWELQQSVVWQPPEGAEETGRHCVKILCKEDDREQRAVEKTGLKCLHICFVSL